MATSSYVGTGIAQSQLGEEKVTFFRYALDAKGQRN